MNANGIEVRPYADPTFALPEQAQANQTHIIIEQGGTVTSQQGIGIKDDNRRAASDLEEFGAAPIIETYDNETTVDLWGTVTGGNGTAMDLGGGTDNVTLYNTAVVNGDILMGNGDDTLALFGGAQLEGLEFGLGTDTLALDGAAGTVSNISLLEGGNAFALGYEILEKRGDGTWIFDGDDLPESGDLVTGFIQQGTAIVNANLTVVDMINEMEGRLEGTGGVRSLNNSGVFSPGGSGTVAAFEVAGDLMLNADGTLEVDIMTDGTSDQVNVGGETTLGGTLAVNAIGLASDYAQDDEFNIINSDGGVSGTFDSTTDNLPDLNVIVAVENSGGSTDLVVVGFEPEDTTEPPEPPEPPQPPEPPTPEPPTPNMSDKSVHPNAMQGAAHAGRALADLLQDRSGGGAAGQSNQAELRSRISNRGYTAASGRHITWASVYGSWLDVDGSAVVTGFDANTAGLALGYEHVIEQQGASTLIGIAASYGQTDIDAGLSSTEIDSYSIGVYASHDQSNWRFSGALTYGTQDYDINRVIPIGAGFVTANGDADGSVFAASAKIAYDIAPSLGLSEQNATRLAPYLRFDHVEVDRDAFVETGAGVLNLAVASDSFSQSSVSLGVETSSKIQGHDGSVIQPYFDFHWEHIFDGRSATSNSFVAGTPAATFTTAGAFEDRDRIGVGAGVRYEMTNNSVLDMRYSGKFADGYTDHAASVEFRMNF